MCGSFEIWEVNDLVRNHALSKIRLRGGTKVNKIKEESIFFFKKTRRAYQTFQRHTETFKKYDKLISKRHPKSNKTNTMKIKRKSFTNNSRAQL